jgi:hypothetical protein
LSQGLAKGTRGYRAVTSTRSSRAPKKERAARRRLSQLCSQQRRSVNRIRAADGRVVVLADELVAGHLGEGLNGLALAFVAVPVAAELEPFWPVPTKFVFRHFSRAARGPGHVLVARDEGRATGATKWCRKTLPAQHFLSAVQFPQFCVMLPRSAGVGT